LRMQVPSTRRKRDRDFHRCDPLFAGSGSSGNRDFCRL
jgi:hypothetical protein